MMMASELVCGLLFRLLLPLGLAAACLFRYNWLSFVYLIFLLLIPLFAEPTKTTMQGHTGRLLKSLCFTSMTFLLLHIIYQITINSLLAGDSIEPNFNCSSWERSIRQLGFESVRGADAGNGIRVFIPDIGMFVLGLVTWLLCRSLENVSQHNSDFELDDQEKEDEEEDKKSEKLELEDELLFEDFELGDEDRELPEEEEVDVEDGELEETDVEESTKMKILRQIADVASKLKEIVGNLITTAGKVVVTILLGLTGMMLPSLTSTVYFFTFLGLCTWWSFCRTFDPLLFSCLCVLMAIFSAGHLIMLYLYQFQFFQEAVPPGNTYASLFGISPVVQTDCSHTWMFRVNPDLEWHHFVNPIMLLVLYYTLATLIRLWLQESEDMVREKEGETEEREEPESPESNMADYTAEKKRQLWRMAHYRTDERHLLTTQEGYSTPEVLMVTSNGASLDFTSVLHENGPKPVELYSSPHYRPGRPQSDPQKVDCGVYKIDSVYVELPEVPQPFGVVRVNAAVKAFRFIMKQSYICALIAMMAWSITYVSWLTFVFLIWSCILWMVRDRRKYSMITSPFMVFYGNLLIILQYIWSFESLQPVPGLFLKKEVPFRELGSKTLCLLSFWLLLRQFLTERREKQTVETQLSDVRLHYERWRWMLKYFWMSVVVYTMLVLILVYTFQFESSINVWSNMTGMSREKLEDLGLEKFSLPALFTRIFIPTSFLLVCILHLHYFHERFLELTDIKSVADKQKSTITRCDSLKNKWHLVVERLAVLFLKFLEYVQKLQLFIWWLLELHIIKIVSSYIIWLSVREVSLFNYVFLVSWAFALPFSQFRPLASSVCTVWTCVIVVCKMLYQLTSINPSSYSRSCSMPENYTDAQRSDMARSLLYSGPVDPANWIGFRKFSPLLENLRNNLLMLALLAFEVTIYRHQDFYRMKNNLPPPVTRTVFHNITRQHLDDGIVNCAKYFIDYFFYKFGLETCFLLAVNVIGQRMDFYAMLHAFGLIAVMYQRRRKAIARVWSKYCFFLACMLAFQYLMCIGIPPATCTDYPWRRPSSSMDSNVIKWLYFPDFHTKPSSLFLLYDFMLLLCASLQGRVFEEESVTAVQLLAGDNVEICRGLDAASFSQHNPVPDFIHCRSYLDMLKVMMFSYLFWFVLTIIFITGTTRISIFCMGYLLACFYFLIFGGELLLKPIKSILHYWDFLIAYNVFVITMKNILSIAACGYIKALVVNHCWLIQLFSLACTIKGYSKRAELFQATIVKAVKARIEEEKKSMDLLKRQMDRIKSRQQKFKRGKERMLSLAQESGESHSGVKEEEEDDEGDDSKEKKKDKRKQWWKPWVDHASMVRSGNYYLFETDSEEEEEDEDKKDEEPPKRSAFQFVYRAWITDSKTAMKERSKERRRFWQRYTERSTNKKNQKQVHVAIEEGDQEEGVTEQEVSDGPDNTLKRVFNIVKFSWVLFLALLDGFTAWLNSICQEHIDISTVLRIERCMLTHEVKKGNNPSRDSIHTYYQRQMCRPASAEDEYSDFSPLRSQAYESDLSRENLSSVYTESTVLYESTLDQPEETSDSVLKSSQRSRPRLCRLPSVDLQSSSELSSQQGTSDTVEEADLPEHPDKLWSSTSDLPPPSYSKATGLDSAGRTEGSRLRIQTPDDEKSADTQLTASELLQSRMFYDEELEASEHFYRSQPQLLQLCYALYSMLVAHSQMVCYLVIILNHVISASVATLVLPILIFLWAMLSVPRPSKRFWMTAIVYTEVTIVIKYFFQFGFFPFNQSIKLDKSKPFHPPNIIGVEKKEGYVHYDLIQLLALFFHRSILKCYGLWDEDEPRSGGQISQHTDSEKSPADASPRKPLHSSSAVRRQSSSVSQRSHPSKAGSSGTRTSSLSAQQKSRKQLIIEKLREQLIKAKRFTVRTILDIYIPIRQFFYNLIHPEYSAVTDVYVLMFLADTVDFIIIVFGFWAFGKHSAAADITSSLSEDQVPEAFLVMVLIQFGTMVVDRALYLRKTVMGKVIFQVILVFGIHFWMFFILPGVTERRFSQNTVAQLWYFVKCIYFGLSAYQIRCGYPTRVLGNFLTKSYNYLNLFLFQGFRLVPFLTELRAVMDWVWTDTTLSLSSWICVEDIYAHIFVLKCWRESEKRYPQPRGQKKKKVVKYGMGGMIVMLLICIVWFPLLFMSLVKSVAGVVNKPLDVSVTITLGGFQPIFTMSAQQNQLKDITDRDFISFMNSYRHNSSALQFLEAYTAEDVTVAELEGSSNSLWTISPPSRKNLMEVLSKEDQFPVTMSWSIQRNLSLGAKAEFAVDKHITYLDMNTRQELIALLNGTRNKPVVIEQVFPCFIRAPSDSNAKPVGQLYTDEGYKSIQLDLERSHNGTEDIQEWWIVDQPSAGKIQMRSESKLEKKREAGLQLYVFSDKVSPPSLGFLAGYGIMGLYASVVLVIGKFVREFFSGISHSIMFEELPCVDRILKLCTDIFLVRETGELELEEDLYAKLIFLYRSPETMIKWTREKTK
ncbi:piezo-type mechanosensitive ion channel component 2-like [Sinocyclocheilus rhinocerous]|uniref:piezo-type mechanosensitive ion channel component 2-like n=1 Tax=Sinocyclocheilus rhinocerous TaxID=307959 RepID=UPI0007B90596|nr:PREDICTED: piezo-type mechanosensitive ion channel component 2-like [Sinocyclocheilus rhinocerous]